VTAQPETDPSLPKPLRSASVSSKDARWLEANRAAIESSNKYVAEFGLSLASLRLF
jgi:post-segregation antitoxin (ccd killing protein)